ncbi:MAG: hypothetical protein E3J81_03575 [Dehalococcoidia bacterium]|nr:MAG: hypothetical protein E3J81_03575 [Dehalococcoidia bacterium]
MSRWTSYGYEGRPPEGSGRSPSRQQKSSKAPMPDRKEPSDRETLARRLAETWLEEIGKNLDRIEMADFPQSWEDFPEERKELFRRFADVAMEELCPTETR